MLGDYLINSIGPRIAHSRNVFNEKLKLIRAMSDGPARKQAEMDATDEYENERQNALGMMSLLAGQRMPAYR